MPANSTETLPALALLRAGPEQDFCVRRLECNEQRTTTGSFVMVDENPKLDPHPNTNTEKDSGNDPMTGAQASYLKTLCEQAHEPDAFSADLTKAEASKRIDELKQRLSERNK
jgi:hypothetical protein